MNRLRFRLRPVLVPALALVTALVVGAVLIVLTDYEHLRQLGDDPAGALAGALGGVLKGYGAMLSGAIGDPGRIVAAIQSGRQEDVANAIRPLSETLLTATPFIFLGLALAVSFHAGLINLGADGQFLMGGFGAGITVSLLPAETPPGLALLLAIAGGTVFGAAYGFIPGFLKARTGAHEVITTLMLNPIAPNLAFFIASLGFFGRGGAQVDFIPVLFDLPTIRLDWGFVAALVVAALVSFVLFRTTLGFELRAIGLERSAARGAGIPPGRTVMLAMTLSGGLVGLGSALFLLGPAHGLPGGPTFDMGYVALALALIGGLRPGGIVLVAILYGALNNGAKQMVIVTGIPLALLVFVIGVAMLFVAAPGLIRTIWRLRAADEAEPVTTRPVIRADQL